MTCEWRPKASEVVTWVDGELPGACLACLRTARKSVKLDGVSEEEVRLERHRSLDCIGLCRSSREFWESLTWVVFKALRVDWVISASDWEFCGTCACQLSSSFLSHACHIHWEPACLHFWNDTAQMLLISSVSLGETHTQLCPCGW